MLSCDSAVQATTSSPGSKGSGPAEACESGRRRPAADPTIVTPQSADWLVDMVHRVRARDRRRRRRPARSPRPGSASSPTAPWPSASAGRTVDLGYADILALRADPEGWAAYPTARRTEWGRRPLLAFTNPSTSTSGRNVLVSLYSIAAGKPPAELTVADIERPEVVQYVKDFQQLVDHYMPGTIPMNTKIVQGTRFGHFFLMPEDNLVSLATGKEKAYRPRTARPSPCPPSTGS